MEGRAPSLVGVGCGFGRGQCRRVLLSRGGACGPCRGGGGSPAALVRASGSGAVRRGPRGGRRPAAAPRARRRRRRRSARRRERRRRRSDEGQAPLHGDRRRRECLRDGGSGPVCPLLLDPPAHDPGVRGRPVLEEGALLPLRLEQDELRCGSACASGIPGAPPPEPTSTTGSPSPSSRGTARSESSTSTRRASSGSRSAVRPGVSRTAWSQSVATGRRDDDAAVGLVTLAVRLDAVRVLQVQMHDLPLGGAHRLEPYHAARPPRFGGRALRELDEPRPPA